MNETKLEDLALTVSSLSSERSALARLEFARQELLRKSSGGLSDSSVDNIKIKIFTEILVLSHISFLASLQGLLPAGLFSIVKLTALKVFGGVPKKQQIIPDPESNYRKIIDLCRSSEESDPGLVLPLLADTFNSMGALYQRQNRLEEAEIAYREALAIFLKLNDLDEKEFEIALQGTVPDDFFTDKDINRLEELMDKWREFRDHNGEMTTADQEELDRLIEKELEASILRVEKNEEELASK